MLASGRCSLCRAVIVRDAATRPLEKRLPRKGGRAHAGPTISICIRSFSNFRGADTNGSRCGTSREHLTLNQRVEGSSPSTLTNKINEIAKPCVPQKPACGTYAELLFDLLSLARRPTRDAALPSDCSSC